MLIRQCRQIPADAGKYRQTPATAGRGTADTGNRRQRHRKSTGKYRQTPSMRRQRRRTIPLLDFAGALRRRDADLFRDHAGAGLL
jgi:hypothetical protein